MQENACKAKIYLNTKQDTNVSFIIFWLFYLRVSRSKKTFEIFLYGALSWSAHSAAIVCKSSEHGLLVDPCRQHFYYCSCYWHDMGVKSFEWEILLLFTIMCFYIMNKRKNIKNKIARNRLILKYSWITNFSYKLFNLIVSAIKCK